jgi:cell division protease FtsH
MAKPPPKQNQSMRVGMFFAAVLLLIVLMNMMGQKHDEPDQMKFSEFLALMDLPETDPSRIVEVTFKENEITGTRLEGATVKTYGPNDAEMRKALTDKGIKVNFDPPEEMSWWKTMLIQALPLLLILVLFIFFMRQLQIGGGKAMSFGKSKAKLLNENQTKITFDDVSGVDEAKQELEEIIEFLRDPKKFTRLGGRIPKGVLLVGSPGTGKTILAKAIAGEAGVPFFSISGSDFVEMFVGVGASRVRDLFEQSKKHAPCIVFIDEIDAVGRHRGAGLGGGHDEREQTLNQLLVEMDGFESNEGVIIVAATNRPDVLDPALLRPGRFDRRVTVPKPDVQGRIGILKVHSRKSPLAKDVKLPTIAQGTPGFSGADLENLVNEAALIAARKNAKEVNMNHFELAKDKILMGPERRSMFMGVDEKRNTAYHEAGHTLVGLKTAHVDPVHKVSIIPRGQALGVTIMLPEEDRYSLTKEYAEGMIAYAMGGRAAEELMFNKQTTGASDDIKKATDIARKMVCHWGMSEKLGPLSLGKDQEEVFLGKEISSSRNFSEKVAEEIDKEIHRLVSTAYKNAMTILTENKDKLEAIAESLLVKETLDAKQIKAIMDGEQIVTEEERKTYFEAQEKMSYEQKNPPLDKKPEGKSKDSNDDTSSINALPQGT